MGPRPHPPLPQPAAVIHFDSPAGATCSASTFGCRLSLRFARRPAFDGCRFCVNYFGLRFDYQRLAIKFATGFRYGLPARRTRFQGGEDHLPEAQIIRACDERHVVCDRMNAKLTPRACP